MKASSSSRVEDETLGCPRCLWATSSIAESWNVPKAENPSKETLPSNVLNTSSSSAKSPRGPKAKNLSKAVGKGRESMSPERVVKNVVTNLTVCLFKFFKTWTCTSLSFLFVYKEVRCHQALDGLVTGDAAPLLLHEALCLGLSAHTGCHAQTPCDGGGRTPQPSNPRASPPGTTTSTRRRARSARWLSLRTTTWR